MRPSRAGLEPDMQIRIIKPRLFLAFGTSRVSFIQLFGLGTGLAILIDATLVRGVLGAFAVAPWRPDVRISVGRRG